jgi:hypothetical protein
MYGPLPSRSGGYLRSVCIAGARAGDLVGSLYGGMASVVVAKVDAVW